MAYYNWETARAAHLMWLYSRYGLGTLRACLMRRERVIIFTDYSVIIAG